MKMWRGYYWTSRKWNLNLPAFSKPAVLTFQLLVNCYEQDRSVYESLDQQKGKVRLSRALEMLSQVLDSELASHIKGRLPQLEGKVWSSLSLVFISKSDHGNTVGWERDRKSASIAKWRIIRWYFQVLLQKRSSPTRGSLSNDPELSYGDSYLDIKEDALVLAMPLDPLEVIHLSHIFGLEERTSYKD
jgi:hypothetical protein